MRNDCPTNGTMESHQWDNAVPKWDKPYYRVVSNKLYLLRRVTIVPRPTKYSSFFLRWGLQLALADAEGVTTTHIACLESQFQPLHALCAGAVGEAFGL